MVDNDNRPCPSCQFMIKGVSKLDTDQNWKEFICLTCDEIWYEDTKYCLAKFQYPEELVN